MGFTGQFHPVPETQSTPEKARRWSAYVCPDCRFVFRVPRDHDGEGIVCPSCRRMLRIPREGDETAPLMSPLKKIGFSEDEAGSRGEKRTRSKRKKKEKEAEMPGWDASSGTWRSNSNRKSRTAKIFAVWICGMAFVAATVIGIVKLSEAEPADGVPQFATEQDQFDDLFGNPLIIPEGELEVEVPLPKVMKKSEVEFLAEAEPMAKAFLDAENTEEILTLVHDSERLRPLIRSRYPDGKIEPTGMSKFNSSGQVSYKDSFAAVTILTPDYETRQLAFVDGEEGLKIDWESWVGWSDMPWEKIVETKPKRPILVRVMAKWVDYYNFGFSSEDEWRSYRLVSPDGETTLYGYVERNSLLDQRLRPGEQGATVAVTLKIRFREDEAAPNQVVIEELVADGWVVVGGSE